MSSLGFLRVIRASQAEILTRQLTRREVEEAMRNLRSRASHCCTGLGAFERVLVCLIISRHLVIAMYNSTTTGINTSRPSITCQPRPCHYPRPVTSDRTI